MYMFKLDIAANFTVGSYTFNTTPLSVKLEPVTVGNVTAEGYHGLVWNNEIALTTKKPFVPQEFEAKMSVNFKRVHNWKTKSGHYESYWEVLDGHSNIFYRYIWNWQSKSSFLQRVMQIDNFYLPVSKQVEIFEADEMSPIEKDPAFDTVWLDENKNIIAEKVFSVAKTDAFKAEIQKMLLETPTVLHAIARIVSHAYMPLTYKQLIEKAFIGTVIELNGDAIVAEPAPVE